MYCTVFRYSVHMFQCYIIWFAI